jgi:HTH-type transcriptional regulator/antitoxin MqsA
MCGGEARLITSPFEVHVGNRSATVEAERMRCDACGAEFFLPGQMDAAQRLGAAKMRSAEGLLAPEEIKAFRETRGITQAQLERLLGVGPKTVVRWERGTVFQNPATDALLRVIRGVPAAGRYLAELRGVDLPPAPTAPQLNLPTSVITVRYFVSEVEHLQQSLPLNGEPDPKVVSISSYLAKKNLKPIPPELLQKAQL